MSNLLSEIDFEELKALDSEVKIDTKKTKNAMTLTITILKEQHLNQKIKELQSTMVSAEKAGSNTADIEEELQLTMQDRQKWQVMKSSLGK
jgi:hypothetical protein